MTKTVARPGQPVDGQAELNEILKKSTIVAAIMVGRPANMEQMTIEKALFS
jgi:hypothetical protein